MKIRLPGCVYVLPESPPLYLPDDWRERVRAVGSVVFNATPERPATLANLQAALELTRRQGGKETGETSTPSAPCLPVSLSDLPADEVLDFFGLGFGFLLQTTLTEAMEHENLLQGDAFWDDVQQAIATRAGIPYTSERFDTPPAAPESSQEGVEGNDPSWGAAAANLPPAGDMLLEIQIDWKQHLCRAADRLLTAREVLYPVTIHLLDLVLLDNSKPGGIVRPTALAQGNPVNILASGVQLEQLARENTELLNLLREPHRRRPGRGLRRPLPRTRRRAAAGRLAALEPAPWSGNCPETSQLRHPRLRPPPLWLPFAATRIADFLGADPGPAPGLR